MSLQAVVQTSGGLGSWAAAKRAVATFGKDNVTQLFADVKMEDEDLYRFLEESTADVGARLVTVTDGRNPWEVFKDVRFIGNSRIDPCSKILKRELLRKWIDENCDPADTYIVLGIDWTEIHRFDKAYPRWKPFELWAPLCEESTSKDDIAKELAEAGILPPRLYAMGFPHNNCGGFCVKAGQSQFKLLYEQLPERYAWHEQQERETQEIIGKPVTIMRDRRGGTSKPLSMEAFRLRLEAKESVPTDEWGGCGCALD